MDRVETKYGLRLKGEKDILQYSTSSVDSNVDFSVGIEYSLENGCGEKEWLLDTLFGVIYVMFHKTERYNADHDTPYHSYNPEQLEIVIVERVITETVSEAIFIKVKLNWESIDNREKVLPFYDSNNKLRDYNDARKMKDKIGTAIDLGDKIQIVFMQGVWVGRGTEMAYDKKYFDIIEED